MANENNNIQPASGEENKIVIYTTGDGKVNLEVQIDVNTVWLTQQQICLLYGKAKSTISEHLKHIFEEGELDSKVVVRENRTTTQHGAIEGKTQENLTRFYNLDAIIAVGFRVRSKQGTLFRQWAIERLKNYIVKGFDIDSERLKGNGGGQYWYELLNTIKDIRSSEKVLYRQVLDLYATSVDYNATDEETILFFKMVQNKLHYATHGQTAAELIYSRSDAEKEFMGLTTFRGPQPTKAEVMVAKNYLSETELRKLNNMVSGYFDFAENRALDHIPTTMHDYRVMLDNILLAGGNAVLQDAGNISALEAREKALDEYRKYQMRTLSPVEQAYIAQLKAEAKKAKGRK
ncbi:MAG: virulence RhuM family protein [Prevotellaceae bacterium]|nr:virulence RhuM family protein [Prevotellaceae bacterium]